MWCPTHGILALQGKLFDHYIYVAKGLHHSKAVKHMGLSSSHTRAKPYQNSKWGVSERNCHSRNGYSTCVRVTINSCVLKTSVDTVVYDYRILVYFNWLKCFWVWLDCEFVLHNVLDTEIYVHPIYTTTTTTTTYAYIYVHSMCYFGTTNYLGKNNETCEDTWTRLLFTKWRNAVILLHYARRLSSSYTHTHITHSVN